MWKKQRRDRLKAAPFPPEWSRILQEAFPRYSRLPEADRKELEGHIQVFLAEKRIEGCGGLELSEAMKVCIAAQAHCEAVFHGSRQLHHVDHLGVRSGKQQTFD